MAAIGPAHLHQPTCSCNTSPTAYLALTQPLKQTLGGAMAVARQLLPSAQAQLQSMGPALHKSERPLTGTQRRAQRASLRKAAGAAVQAAAEAGAQLPHRCAHCGKAAVGLRRCARCRRADASYCRWAWMELCHWCLGVRGAQCWIMLQPACCISLCGRALNNGPMLASPGVCHSGIERPADLLLPSRFPLQSCMPGGCVD